MTADITKLVTLILGISISGERLVTLIKTIIPSLAAPPVSAGDQPADSGKEIIKKIILMAIAFLCCYLTAYLINGSSNAPVVVGGLTIPVYFLGLLASGGSAFWTNILGYLSSLKDLTTQQGVATKMAIRARLAGVAAFDHALTKEGLSVQVTDKQLANLKTVRFTTTFSGGPGTLKIKISGYPDLDFDKNETKTISLAPGNYLYSASGAAATGDGGACVLTIDGNVIVDSPQNYGAGLIVPNIHPMIVTD